MKFTKYFLLSLAILLISTEAFSQAQLPAKIKTVWQIVSMNKDNQKELANSNSEPEKFNFGINNDFYNQEFFKGSTKGLKDMMTSTNPKIALTAKDYKILSDTTLVIGRDSVTGGMWISVVDDKTGLVIDRFDQHAKVRIFGFYDKEVKWTLEGFDAETLHFILQMASWTHSQAQYNKTHNQLLN